jgi:protein TonB
MRHIRAAVVVASAVAVFLGSVGVLAQAMTPQVPQTKEDLEFLRGTVSLQTPGLIKPRPTREVKPRYTPEAMRAKLQGSVTVQVVVETNGTVARARVLESAHSEFNDLALEAVKAWRFDPATLNGEAVSVAANLTLEFRLH